MRYLTAAEILVLHALVVDATGGSHGVRDTSLLESIVHKPKSSFGGHDLYSTLFLKAAVLCEAIVNYHVFVDGNKRTALIATGRFLALNGFELIATSKEAERAILSVAGKAMTVKELSAWLKKNAKRVLKKRRS